MGEGFLRRINGYEFSIEAASDLEEIWLFIAKDNPVAADKLEAEIYEACEFLVKNPDWAIGAPTLLKTRCSSGQSKEIIWLFTNALPDR